MEQRLNVEGLWVKFALHNEFGTAKHFTNNGKTAIERKEDGACFLGLLKCACSCLDRMASFYEWLAPVSSSFNAFHSLSLSCFFLSPSAEEVALLAKSSFRYMFTQSSTWQQM